MRRISNKSKAALAALGMLGLSACNPLSGAGQRAQNCLMNDDLLALSKENVFINGWQYKGNSGRGAVSALIVLPNGATETATMGAANELTGKRDAGLQRRVATALATACTPYYHDYISVNEAARRIKLLNVGAGVTKFDLKP